MLRMFVVPVVLLAVITCCMGQTFQYSRGWTNGKRSPSHFREESVFPADIIETDTENKLEKCLLNLQRIIHNPFIFHSSLMNPGVTGNTNNKFQSSGHRQSNEIIEDPESIDFIKRQT